MQFFVIINCYLGTKWRILRVVEISSKSKNKKSGKKISGQI